MTDILIMEYKIRNICILIRTLYSGGAEKQSVFLAKALKDDFTVFVVVQKGKNVEKKYIDSFLKNNISFLLLKGGRLKRARDFYSFLIKNEIDLVFSFLTSDNIWSATIGKLADVRIRIGGVRNESLPAYKFNITKLLYRYLLQGLIFNSYRGYHNFIEKGFNAKRSFVIHNCLEPIPDYYKRRKRRVVKILTVARFVKGKDYLTAIKTFHFLLNQLMDKKDRIEYYIIGYGKMNRKINQWVKAYNLGNHVKVILRPDDLERYYRDSDIYLSTSIIEGMSNSIMEAMGFSLPVVATNAGDNEKLVIDGISGFVEPVRCYKKLATALNALVGSYDKRIKFGEAGYNHLRSNFSFEKYKMSYLQLMQFLMKK